MTKDAQQHIRLGGPRPRTPNASPVRGIGERPQSKPLAGLVQIGDRLEHRVPQLERRLVDGAQVAAEGLYLPQGSQNLAAIVARGAFNVVF